jgi:hypothetical protein
VFQVQADATGLCDICFIQEAYSANVGIYSGGSPERKRIEKR